MTLNTQIYILDPVDREELFSFCHSLLEPDKEVAVKRTSKSLINPPGMGFPAWLFVHGNEDGEPLCEGDPTRNPLDAETFIEAILNHNGFYAKVAFDTGYSYLDEFGGCTELHARYLVQLYNWLVVQGCDMLWVNEYTGAINKGLDGIAEFLWSANAEFTSKLLEELKRLGYNAVQDA